MRTYLALLVVTALAVVPSCSSILTPENQAKLDAAATKYENATGLTAGQTVGLLGKWWVDLQSARDLNKKLNPAAVPLDPIQATRASPLLDYTNGKAVMEGLNPQASATPSDDQGRGEGDMHPERQSPKAPAPRRRLPKPRVNEESSAQLLTRLGGQRTDRHPALPGDEQTLTAESQLPDPALLVGFVLHRQSEGGGLFFHQARGQDMPHPRHGHAPRLATTAGSRVEVIGADDLPAF